MPVLGSGGVLELRRELPPPVAIGTGALRVHANSVDLTQPGYWTGDKVFIWGPRGIPFDLNGDGTPDLDGGFGMFFGSTLGLYGPRAARLQSGESKWFGSEPPFGPSDATPIVTSTQLYIFRDRLDRISFYQTLSDALEGGTEKRLKLFPVDFGLLLIAPAEGSGFAARLQPGFSDLASYAFVEGESEKRADQITDKFLPEPKGDNSDRPWRFMAEMDDWVLELDASEIDTTGIGQQFGESTRALVTGGGTINFFLNRVEDEDNVDATYLARLMILLEQGCKAEAVFTVAKPKAKYPVLANQRRVPRGGISYNAELIFSQSAVNTRADDLIRGSAKFVTIGRVRLAVS